MAVAIRNPTYDTPNGSPRLNVYVDPAVGAFDLTPPGPDVVTTRLDQLVRAEVVVLDAKERRLASVPVRFDRRLRSGTLGSLLGADASGSFTVSLEVNLETRASHLRFRFRVAEAATPEMLLPIVSLLEKGRAGNRLGIWLSDAGRWGAAPAPIPEDAPRPAPEFVQAVRTLARIARRSGASFTMPREIDQETAASIGRVDRLLLGEHVTGNWSAATIADDAELVAFLEASPHGAMVEFTAQLVLHLDGRDIPIGDVEYRLPRVRLTKGGSGEMDLEPWDDDTTFELRLICVRTRSHDDGTAAWVPESMLEPLRGRWVAQSGTSFVGFGGSFTEVSQAVRASGRLATVWFVPSGDSPPEFPVAV